MWLNERARQTGGAGYECAGVTLGGSADRRGPHTGSFRNTGSAFLVCFQPCGKVNAGCSNAFCLPDARF